MGLGYWSSVTEGNKWLSADSNTLDKPTILLLSRKDYPHDKLLSMLSKIKAPILGIFACDNAQWDEEVLTRCTDFLGWPCHKDELELRLQRVFREPECGASTVDEVALLEELGPRAMKLKIAVYKMEWMVNLFTKEGEPETTGKDGERSTQLAEIVSAIDPDILGGRRAGHDGQWYEVSLCAVGGMGNTSWIR